MKRANMILGFVFLVASGCATTQQAHGPSRDASAYAVERDPQDPKAKPEDSFDCDWEHVVGTNVRQRVCWQRLQGVLERLWLA